MAKTQKNLAITLISALLISGLYALPANANGAGVCGPENFAGGDGSEGNPYQVAEVADIDELADCGGTPYFYVQTQDIDLAAVNRTPMAYFTGNYDGQNHSITGIRVENYGRNNVGLFETLSGATFENVNLEGYALAGGGRENTGLLTAVAISSTFVNIDVSFNVTGGTNVGGLVGAAYESNFDQIWMRQKAVEAIQANGSSIGGLVGYSRNSDITNIFSSAVIYSFGAATNLGGIIGTDVQTIEGDHERTNLQYLGGQIYAPDAGTSNCGGFVGYGNFPISDSVSNSPVRCEKENIGGAAGSFTSSLSKVRVSANIEAAKANDLDNEGAVGGLIGLWGGDTEERNIEKSSFNGNVKGEWNVGGLVGMTELAYGNQVINISKTFSNSALEATRSTGGLSGGLYFVNEENSVNISESYFAVTFTQESEYRDSVIYTFGNEMTFDRVAWLNTDAAITGSAQVDTLGRTSQEMQLPGTWERSGFDMDTTWGISSGVNSNFPILRENYEESQQYDVNCVKKSFTKILFAKKSAKLTSQAKKSLDKIAGQISNSACSMMNVYGFASKSEQKKSNKLYTRQLSLKRVTAVLNYLTPKLENIGVTYMNYDRLGAGTRNLLNKDKTKKQQAANRRVEISTIS